MEASLYRHVGMPPARREYIEGARKNSGRIHVLTDSRVIISFKEEVNAGFIRWNGRYVLTEHSRVLGCHYANRS